MECYIVKETEWNNNHWKDLERDANQKNEKPLMLANIDLRYADLRGVIVSGVRYAHETAFFEI